jgi:CheY-like chemotaxis protein
MPDDLETLVTAQSPTPEQPLLGLTVLVVEDSRYASEAMRLLCLRSGARIRRADSLRAAHRHLSVYRPSVVIVDLGLPDGPGTTLIAELAAASPRVPAILAISGDAGGEAAARAAGADGFLLKPVASVPEFQRAVLAHLARNITPNRAQPGAEGPVSPDPLALHEDLAHISRVIGRGPRDGKAIDYVAQFLSGVARMAADPVLESAASRLAERRRHGQPANRELAHLAGLVRQRLAAAQTA